MFSNETKRLFFQIGVVLQIPTQFRFGAMVIQDFRSVGQLAEPYESWRQLVCHALTQGLAFEGASESIVAIPQQAAAAVVPSAQRMTLAAQAARAAKAPTRVGAAAASAAPQIDKLHWFRQFIGLAAIALNWPEQIKPINPADVRFAYCAGKQLPDEQFKRLCQLKELAEVPALISFTIQRMAQELAELTYHERWTHPTAAQDPTASGGMILVKEYQPDAVMQPVQQYFVNPPQLTVHRSRDFYSRFLPATWMDQARIQGLRPANLRLTSITTSLSSIQEFEAYTKQDGDQLSWICLLFASIETKHKIKAPTKKPRQLATDLCLYYVDRNWQALLKTLIALNVPSGGVVDASSA